MGTKGQAAAESEPVIFSIFSCFLHIQPAGFQADKTVILSEALRRSISTEGFMARSRRACPERSRGNPGDACWQMLLRAFRPQTATEDKKSQTPSEADLSRRAVEGSAVPRPFVEMFFDTAYPDFLPRRTGQGIVCAFLQGKTHDLCQRHQLPQEIRGSAVERSAVFLSASTSV
jgi:hypothetical protein